MHTDNAFITLTFNDENLPLDESICKPTLQKFFKRLRKNTGAEIRFLSSAEYGDKYNRPHYHALLFGYDFPDLKYWREVRGSHLYTSEILSDAWQNQGFVTIGDISFQSAAYVARYVVKKHKGKNAFYNYQHITRYGEPVQLTPEFATMSNQPGLGSSWYDKFKTDVFPDDFILMDGRKKRVPRYYLNKLEIAQPDLYQAIIKTRKEKHLLHPENNTPDRLEIREFIHNLKAQKLIRQMEPPT